VEQFMPRRRREVKRGTSACAWRGELGELAGGGEDLLLLLLPLPYGSAAVASASAKKRNPCLDPFDDGPDEELNYRCVFSGGKQEEDHGQSVPNTRG
jgi:hypothetical protein